MGGSGRPGVRAGRRLTCLYASDPAQIGQEMEVQLAGGRLATRLSLPGAGLPFTSEPVRA